MPAAEFGALPHDELDGVRAADAVTLSHPLVAHGGLLGHEVFLDAGAVLGAAWRVQQHRQRQQEHGGPRFPG